jgi:hypothetical protein
MFRTVFIRIRKDAYFVELFPALETVVLLLQSVPTRK